MLKIVWKIFVREGEDRKFDVSGLSKKRWGDEEKQGIWLSLSVSMIKTWLRKI